MRLHRARPFATAVACAAAFQLALAPRVSAAPGGSFGDQQSAQVATSQLAAGSRHQVPVSVLAQDGGRDQTTSEQIAVGIGGRHEVTPTGGFAYHVPIELPRWRGRLTPELALTYDSQARAGALGVGATLTGFPAIVRVPHDHGVTYQNDKYRDRFAVAWNGWGSAASPGGLLVEDPARPGTWRTSEESWMLFEPVGDDCDPGPCAWRMRAPDGSVSYFGGTEDSTLPELPGGFHGVRGIRAWGLMHVTDVHGNSYGITYDEDDAMMYPRFIVEGCEMIDVPDQPWTTSGGDLVIETDPGEAVPVTIPPGMPPGSGYSYDPTNPFFTSFDPWIPPPPPPPGGGDVLVPGGDVVAREPGGSLDCPVLHSVELHYRQSAPRSDPTPRPERNARLLERIDVKGAGTRLYSYELIYRDSPRTGASRLHTVTRIGAGTELITSPRLPATTFTWSDLQSWRTASPLPAFAAPVTGWTGLAEASMETLTGDLDGDGDDDVVRARFHRDSIRVQFALGRASEGLGTVTLVPLPAGFSSPVADLTHWNVLLADLDADGRKDIVLVLADSHVGRVLIAAGTDNGPTGFVDYGHHTELEHFVDPLSDASWHRALAGDVNGDQVDDLMIVDLAHHDVALILGAAGGPGRPEEFNTPSDGSPGFWHSEPTLLDLDGDDLLDLVLTENRGEHDDVAAGARMFAFLGSRLYGLTKPHEVALSVGAYRMGFSPFHALPTDVDADGTGDLVLAYSGFQDTSIDQERPYGRDVRVVHGDWQFRKEVNEDNEVIALASAPLAARIADTASYPDYSISSHELAAWEHHTGDIDGDGCSDLIAYYAGARGELLDWARADCAGGFGTVTRVTLATSRPDGGWNRHRAHARVVDLDLDGKDDVLRYYAGASGQWVEVSYGTATGLASAVRLLNEPSATLAESSTATDASRASSVQLLVLDANGDGRRDLLLATPGNTLTAGWRTRLALAPSATTTPMPDVITGIANGYGGTVTVAYSSVTAASTGTNPAIDRRAACAPGVADCGLPAAAPRPLVQRVTIGDGRLNTRSTSYAYHNGRYYPGYAIAVDPPATSRKLRADLAFARITATDDQLLTTTVTTYRQDPPFHRQVASVVVSAPLASGWSSSTGLLERRRTSYEYEQVVTLQAPDGRPLAVAVRPTRERYVDLETGTDSRQLTRDIVYGDYGAVTSSTECAEGECVETYAEYEHDPDAWILNRPIHRGRRTSTLLLSHQTTAYDGPLVIERQSLRCDSADWCMCPQDPEACVAQDRGRWITTETGHVYDEAGNLTHVVGPGGQVTDITWDGVYGAQPETITRHVTHDGTAMPIARTTYYDLAGRPRERIEGWWGPGATASTGFGAPPAGRRTVLSYDGHGRSTRTDHPDGSWEIWTYPGTGSPTAQAVQHESSVDATRSAIDSRLYDGLGRVYRTLTPGPGSTPVEMWTEVSIRPDVTGGPGLQRTRVSEPRLAPASGQDPSNLWIEHTADGIGLPIRMARQRGTRATITATWDLVRIMRVGYVETTARARAEVAADGSLIGTPLWLSENRTYDSRGRLLSIIGEENTATDYIYDDALRLWQVWGPYDQGRPLTANQHYNSWSYDSDGRVVVDASSQRGGRVFTYDDAGNLVQREDDLGHAVSWSYDEIGRRLTESSHDGVTEWSYDTAPGGVGLLAEVNGGWGGDRIRGYDGLGRVTELVRTLGDLAPQTVVSQYDLGGRLVGKTLPDGSRQTWRYDAAGNLLGVDLGTTTFLDRFGFDARGHATSSTSPVATSTYNYDANGLLRSTTSASSKDGTTLQALSYRYDTTGNLLAASDDRTQTMVGQVETDTSWTYSYDRLGRLRDATDAAGTTTTMGFDAHGNLVQRGPIELIESPGQLDVQVAAVVTPCIPPPVPGCSGTPAEPLFQIHYDDNGNAVRRHQGYAGLSGPEWSYGYDAHDRLIEVLAPSGEKSTMVYDAAGVRTSRTEEGSAGETTTYFVDPAYEVRVRDGTVADAVATVQVRAPGLGTLASVTTVALSGTPALFDALADAAGPLKGDPIAGYRKGTIHYLSDHLGSPRAVLNAAGAVLTRYAYTPWGELRGGSTGADLTDVGFTGQDRDAASGLVDYGARHYDPSVGRFMTADSKLPGDGGDPLGLNRRTYAFGNPVKFTDPDGHIPFLVIVGVALVLAFQGVKNCEEADISGPMIVASAPVSAPISAAIGLYMTGNRAIDTINHDLDLELEAIDAHIAGDEARVKQIAEEREQIRIDAVVDVGVDLAIGRVVKMSSGTVGKIPKPPRGKGAVPKAERDPKRVWTKNENAAKLKEQGGTCPGCGKEVDIDDARGHHVERHADGGQTVPENQAVVCEDCHKELHKP